MNLYLSAREKELLRDVAEMLGVSQAYVVRLAFRKMIDLPVGDKGDAEYAHVQRARKVDMSKI